MYYTHKTRTCSGNEQRSKQEIATHDDVHMETISYDFFIKTVSVKKRHTVLRCVSDGMLANFKADFFELADRSTKRFTACE